MKSHLFTFALVSFCMCAQAQDRYAVQLKYKGPTTHSISAPGTYLSAKAIQRRANQGIAIDSSDLPVSAAYLSQIANTGAQLKGASRWLNTVTIQTSNPNVLAAVNALPFVQSVDNVGRLAPGMPDPRTEKFALERLSGPVATGGHLQKSAAFNYGPALNQIAMVGGDALHNSGYTGAGMTIAVIDAGFYLTDSMTVFDSLFNAGRVLATWDFTEDEANVYDDGTHGTYVLSVMASNWPGTLVGTAPHADYLLLRSEYGAAELIIEEYDWAEAAEFADSAGADVINSSLSYTAFDDSTQDHTYSDLNGDLTPVTRAADMAASRGMVVCNSAGNYGDGSWFFIGAPADADSILSVGGVDSVGTYVTFSSKGPSADGRVKPDVAAQAFQTYVAELFNAGAIAGNGTSFSSPIIAGMAACLWQCRPSATNMQVIDAIRMSASQFSNPDSLLGYGIPDFQQACNILSVPEDGPEPPGILALAGPNPFSGDLLFTFHPARDLDVVFTVTDPAGRLVRTLNSKVPGGTETTFRMAGDFAAGMYLLSAVTQESVRTIRILKQ